MGVKISLNMMGDVERRMDKIPTVGVGMLGYAFMGKAHSNAYKKIPYIFWPPPAIPKLIAICGRNRLRASGAAERYGYTRYYTDWRDLVKDPEVEIFDNGAPNRLHAEPCIAAAERGKHVICEKPMALTAEEAENMLRAVERTNVKHMVAFNYRFVPAIQVAKKLIDDGVIGRVYHFHGRYLQEWLIDPQFPITWRTVKTESGSGVLGDLGSHLVDLAHYLVGDITSVTAITKTFIEDRPIHGDDVRMGRVDVDDAFECIVEFRNGAVGHISASRVCSGRKNYQHIELYGDGGSIVFNLERLNELDVNLRGRDLPELEPSFHKTLITESNHPYLRYWWPHGHIIGWEHSIIHEIYHFIDSIVYDKPISPPGATFEDGYRCNIVLDAIAESARRGEKTSVNYRI
ncbi:MAG: Gfo/Idh/MocA family oxidoreductase [Candidatus Bathyarchaeia archaeon]